MSLCSCVAVSSQKRNARPVNAAGQRRRVQFFRVSVILSAPIPSWALGRCLLYVCVARCTADACCMLSAYTLFCSTPSAVHMYLQDNNNNALG